MEKVLDRVSYFRRYSSGYMALCPAHEDRKASLSIKENEDGKVLLKCHAGCSTRDVLAAMGLSFADVSAREPEHVYVYRDEQGNPLYEVVRKPGKEFFQRRYEGGRTINGLGDTRRVLYRLPEVLAADPSRTVYVCEGEKDVDALVERGYVATCNLGGAGQWRDEYSEVLRGRHVAVIQDKDTVGRKHAFDVLLSLRSHGVASVRLLEAREGKDAYDHLAYGYDVDDFVEPSFFTPLDFMNTDVHVEWLWSGLVAEGDLALISGPPGIGKSWLTMSLAVAIANGWSTFLDLPVKNGRVLYFDEENAPDVVVSRMVHKLGHQHFADIRYINAEGLMIDKHPEMLMQEVLVYQPALIVIDSLSRVHTREENSFAEMSEILNQVLKPIARKTDAALLLIHHTDKMGVGPRGSGDIEAAVDVSLSVSGERGAGSFWLKMRKSRRRKSGDAMYVVIEDVGGMTRLRRVR